MTFLGWRQTDVMTELLSHQRQCLIKMDRQRDKLVLRGRIVGLRESGKSVREIAAHLGISRATVYLWLRRWEEDGNLNNRPKGRPPRKTTAENDQHIQDAANNDPFTNAEAIREQLQLDVSAQTVRRRLHAAGIHHRTPAKKQVLTPRHREVRLRFAEAHVQEDIEYWAHAVFTDEKTFCSTSHGKLHCWRSNNSRYGLSCSRFHLNTYFTGLHVLNGSYSDHTSRSCLPPTCSGLFIYGGDPAHHSGSEY